MKLKLQKKDVATALNNMRAISSVDCSRKLAYAVAKNIRLLTTELKDLEAARNFPGIDSEAFKALDKARQEIALEFAKKDNYGKVMRQGRSLLLDDVHGYTEAVGKWLDFHDPELKKALNDHDAAVEKFFEEETEIELFEMKLAWFPETFKPEILGLCVDLIADDLEEK